MMNSSCTPYLTPGDARSPEPVAFIFPFDVLRGNAYTRAVK